VQSLVIGVVNQGLYEMIISRLAGGLGNQMFQYAAGRALAYCRGTSLGLDLSALRSRTSSLTMRDYELECFSITCELVDSKNLLLGDIASIFPSLFGLINRKKVFKESSIDYIPNFFTCFDETLLIGYWQSHRYFISIAESIYEEFQPRNPFCIENSEFAKILIDDEHSVALHVRRGDYHTLPSASSFHGSLGDDYYRQAIKLAIDHDDKSNIIIFSDDMEWCRHHFSGLINVHFAPSPGNAQAWEDLVLMSLCRSNVIANSSYSWWSAWLGDMRHGVRNRLVIAPKRWFLRQAYCASDRFPAHWALI
jgi:hypothetical protein